MTGLIECIEKIRGDVREVIFESNFLYLIYLDDREKELNLCKRIIDARFADNQLQIEVDVGSDKNFYFNTKSGLFYEINSTIIKLTDCNQLAVDDIAYLFIKWIEGDDKLFTEKVKKFSEYIKF